MSSLGAQYIAFEGGEGTGKSTQARVLAERVEGLVSFEPGATSLGASLRTLVLDPEQATIGARAETLMMAADRAQHLDEVVLPALAAGRHVVSDRSAYSSLAYQGGGRELGIDEVQTVNDWALGGRWPDAVVLLQLPREEARRRLDRRLDRLEQETEAFHQRVDDTFRLLAARDRQRWHTVPAGGSIEAVAAAVWDAVGHRFQP